MATGGGKSPFAGQHDEQKRRAQGGHVDELDDMDESDTAMMHSLSGDQFERAAQQAGYAGAPVGAPAHYQGDASGVDDGAAHGGAGTLAHKNSHQLCALVRYRNSKNQSIPFIRVFKENEFGSEIQRHPPRDRWWEQIELIQTAIKSKAGSGTPIFVHFVAPLNEDHPTDSIDYSYSHFPSDYNLLRNNDDAHYVLKQCYIIAEYL